MRKVNWAQVGKVTEPGRYMFRFGFVIVTAEDLAIWQRYPEAAFTLIPTLSSGPQEEYKLGVFDVGGGEAS
jgi:hypothetical protein